MKRTLEKKTKEDCKYSQLYSATKLYLFTWTGDNSFEMQNSNHFAWNLKLLKTIYQME